MPLLEQKTNKLGKASAFGIAVATLGALNWIAYQVQR